MKDWRDYKGQYAHVARAHLSSGEHKPATIALALLHRCSVQKVLLCIYGTKWGSEYLRGSSSPSLTAIWERCCERVYWVLSHDDNEAAAATAGVMRYLMPSYVCVEALAHEARAYEDELDKRLAEAEQAEAAS